MTRSDRDKLIGKVMGSNSKINSSNWIDIAQNCNSQNCGSKIRVPYDSTDNNITISKENMGNNQSTSNNLRISVSRN